MKLNKLLEQEQELMSSDDFVEKVISCAKKLNKIESEITGFTFKENSNERINKEIHSQEKILIQDVFSIGKQIGDCEMSLTIIKGSDIIFDEFIMKCNRISDSLDNLSFMTYIGSEVSAAPEYKLGSLKFKPASNETFSMPRLGEFTNYAFTLSNGIFKIQNLTNDSIKEYDYDDLSDICRYINIHLSKQENELNNEFGKFSYNIVSNAFIFTICENKK